MPMGAKPMGAETRWPKISVVVSRRVVSTSWLGMIRWRKKACRLARWVLERPALEDA